MKSLLLALLPLTFLALSGCSQDTSEDSAAQNAGSAGSQAPEDPLPQPDPSGSAQVSSAGDSAPLAEFAPADDSAEAAVGAILRGVSEGHPEVVWAALPADYQNDLNELVQTFGNNMDPQMWTHIIGILETLHKILDTKAEFIANVPELQEQPIEENLAKIAGLLQTVLNIADLDSLKNFGRRPLSCRRGGQPACPSRRNGSDITRNPFQWQI